MVTLSKVECVIVGAHYSYPTGPNLEWNNFQVEADLTVRDLQHGQEFKIPMPMMADDAIRDLIGRKLTLTFEAGEKMV